MGAVELHRTHTDKGTVQLNEVASQADATFRVIASMSTLDVLLFIVMQC